MSAGFVVASVAMLALGFLVAGWPLLRRGRALPAAVLGVALVAGGVALYPLASNFVPEAPGYRALLEATDEQAARAAMATLGDALNERPGDYWGWRLLGRARLNFEDFSGAEFALRQALRVSTEGDPELLVMLGQAISYGGAREIPAEAQDLFIEAYRLAPNEPNTMWFAGLSYSARGDYLAAAEAWEGMLAQDPPPEIRRILTEQIAVLRARAAPANPTAVGDAEALVLNVRLPDGIANEWPAAARLFVSVRDASKPGPPLAAAQFPPGALPLTVELGDDDAMIAGRTISSAERYEIVARVSMNGDPMGGAEDFVARLSLARDQIDGPLELVLAEATP